MKRALLIAAAAVFPVAAACGACGDSPAAPTDAGADAGADAEADARDARDEPKPCIPQERPAYVPDGWVPWDGFTGCSGMYAPTKDSELPAPFEWEPCDSQVAQPPVGCRQLKAVGSVKRLA